MRMRCGAEGTAGAFISFLRLFTDQGGNPSNSDIPPPLPYSDLQAREVNQTVRPCISAPKNHLSKESESSTLLPALYESATCV